ncbi:hypothetical protein P3W85_36760 [Cupriavidus basilensis]|uniref:Uncharacterized protein n=1 Tax=Cupriavidus basilensis TaxID=68895 RepID=A0ABT6B0P0_9BURK|nr:hypothetical protein [Cupriavidus basilensis]MDF3838445.1 hypothetical protein [Cupriavidus basilensis]
MTLDEALAAIEQLPAKERLLVGLLEHHALTWTSGHIDDLDAADDLDPAVFWAVDEFRCGTSRQLVLVANLCDGGQLIIAVGIESASEVSHAISKAKKEFIRRYSH